MKVKVIIVMCKFGHWSGWEWVSSLAWTWAISILGLDDAADMLHPEFGWIWREQ